MVTHEQAIVMNINLRTFAVSLVTSLVSFSGVVEACPQCTQLVKSGIYNQNFAGNLIVLLLPVAILLAIGFGIYFMEPIKARLRKGADSSQTTYNAGH